MNKKHISTLLLSIMFLTVGCSKAKTPVINPPGLFPGQETSVENIETPMKSILEFNLGDFTFDGTILKYNINNSGTSAISFGESYTIKSINEDGTTEDTDLTSEIAFITIQNMVDGGKAVAHSINMDTYKDKFEIGKTYRITRLFLDNNSDNGYEANIDFMLTGEGKLSIETIKTSVNKLLLEKSEVETGISIEGETTPGVETGENGN